ncbi:unnamed protein product [Prorocentrum cordatum]|uniref:Uncharacterized protein n=1 Tax=Prorocentrum cordatum TaxID=2364126 RepID=A0ABN9T8I9_9DINO|nr:unnamed protein product [Polarella glacialis]
MAAATGSEAWKAMFGNAAAAASGPGPTAKTRAVATGESVDTAAKADVALKLNVINAQRMKMVLAIVTMSFAIPVSGEVFQVLEASKASYTAMTEGKKGQGKAPPDVYNVIAAVAHWSHDFPPAERKSRRVHQRPRCRDQARLAGHKGVRDREDVRLVHEAAACPGACPDSRDHG